MIKFVAASSYFQNVGNNDGGANRAKSGSGEGSEGGSDSGRGGNERHVQVWAAILTEAFNCTDRKFPELVEELVSAGMVVVGRWVLTECRPGIIAVLSES